MNKYLEKLAEMSDMKAAREFHHAEEDDVKKYEEAKKTAKNPKLLKAIKYALPEEKIHARLFGEALKDEENK
jgi:rubrerythrin